MRNKHRNLLSVALVLLCIALLAGTAVLLLRTLPKKQPGTVDTIQTGAVFDQTDNTAAPDREQAYDGELPNLSDTLEPDEAETPAPEDEAALAAAKLADQTLASMTLDEKLWQLFFVTPEAITKVETATLAARPQRPPSSRSQSADWSISPKTWRTAHRPSHCWKIRSPIPKFRSSSAWTRRAARSPA